MRSPERRTLAVMLSSDRLTDIASKPVLRPYRLDPFAGSRRGIAGPHHQGAEAEQHVHGVA